MNVVIVNHILFSCLDGVRIKHPDYDHKALMASVGQKNVEIGPENRANNK